MNLYVSKRILNLYIGLIEGENTVATYWNGGIDSSLQKTIKAEIISIMNKDNIKDDIQEFLVLENGETIQINNNNTDRLYNYFIYNELLDELKEQE